MATYIDLLTAIGDVLRATIDDVAALAGVSIKTVSRVMNKEASVRETTKDRVLKAVDELNYRPNAAARSFASKHSFTIACLYQNPNAYYVTDLQTGLLNVLRKNNYELVIHPTSFEDNWQDLISSLKNQARVAGVVLTSPFSEHPEFLAALEKAQIHYVKIISAPPPSEESADLSSVFVDDFDGARQVTKHLIELGHRQIAFIKGSMDHYSTQQRYAGYLSALSEAAIPEPSSLIVSTEYTFDSGQKTALELLSRSHKPSAILAGNDEMAAGVLSAARKLSLNCPGDLAIAGFENSPFSKQSWPRLTTVHQNNIYIAELAAQRLLDIVSQSNKELPTLCYNPRIIKRESTLGED
ncbi:LacI family transcriptional regulator [Umboniibacter marinipuniceus]|uniref:LacI family transcriptional regulator n=1 Tax=Umboniibacter marinipuniceus TaxID=569599 RepID=A0A3M0A0Y0_9GAMM|nr:LacI family transcriptional regulator [Umboniibacter marinipuniceus]